MTLQSIVKSVASWLGAERKRNSRPSMRRTTLTLEALEQREVPANFGYGPMFEAPSYGSFGSYGSPYSNPLFGMTGVPNTFGWDQGGGAASGAAASQVYGGWNNYALTGLNMLAQNMNPYTTPNSLGVQNINNALLQSTPFGRAVGNLTSNEAYNIVYNPGVNSMIQGSQDALFGAGSGFTPLMYQHVANQIQSIPNPTPWTTINLQGAGAVAGLDGRVDPYGNSWNLEPMLGAIQYGGQGIAAMGAPYLAGLGGFVAGAPNNPYGPSGVFGFNG